MTRITIELNGEEIFDAFLDYGNGTAVVIEGSETTIGTDAYVDVEIDADIVDELWSRSVDVVLNGETHATIDELDFNGPIEFNIGGDTFESYDIQTISVQGELA